VKRASERKELTEIIRAIRVARQSGESDADLLRQAASIVPDADVGNLCDSDYGTEMIADYCLGLRKAKRVLTREELLELVQSIRKGPLPDEAQNMVKMAQFAANCVHPGKTDLFFYPEYIIPGRDRFSDEEIVALAMGDKLK
jgi:hypothetical protein